MSDRKDYYDILRVERGCSREELRQAYRRCARANHPDLHPGDAEANRRLQEINEAYETLSDPARQATYDREHARAQRASGAPPSPRPEPTRDAAHSRPRATRVPEDDSWRDDEYYLQYLPRRRRPTLFDEVADRADDELFQLRRLLRRLLR